MEHDNNVPNTTMQHTPQFVRLKLGKIDDADIHASDYNQPYQDDVE